MPEARQRKCPPRQASPAECKEKIVAAFIRIRPLPRQVLPAGRKGKSLQHLHVSARCRGRRCRRGARGKSLQHLPVSARCRGRRCRRGARGKSEVHLSVFAYRRGMCLSGAAEEKRTAFVSRRFCLQILRGHKSLLCIKCPLPPVSAQAIPAGYKFARTLVKTELFCAFYRRVNKKHVILLLFYTKNLSAIFSFKNRDFTRILHC